MKRRRGWPVMPPLVDEGRCSVDKRPTNPFRFGASFPSPTLELYALLLEQAGTFSHASEPMVPSGHSGGSTSLVARDIALVTKLVGFSRVFSASLFSFFNVGTPYWTSRQKRLPRVCQKLPCPEPAQRVIPLRTSSGQPLSTLHGGHISCALSSCPADEMVAG